MSKNSDNNFVNNSLLRLVTEALKEDGAVCDFFSREYNEQATYEGGNGARKAFKQCNDLITQCHQLLKLLVGEQRANLTETIPVIDFFNNENTSFMKEYAFVDDKKTQVDSTSIIDILPASSDPNRDSMSYILEEDPHIINRILMGEPIAEHVYNTTSMSSTDYNLLVGYSSEATSAYTYWGINETKKMLLDGTYSEGIIETDFEFAFPWEITTISFDTSDISYLKTQVNDKLVPIKYDIDPLTGEALEDIRLFMKDSELDSSDTEDDKVLDNYFDKASSFTNLINDDGSLSNLYLMNDVVTTKVTPLDLVLKFPVDSFATNFRIVVRKYIYNDYKDLSKITKTINIKNPNSNETEENYIKGTSYKIGDIDSDVEITTSVQNGCEPFPGMYVKVLEDGITSKNILEKIGKLQLCDGHYETYALYVDSVNDAYFNKVKAGQVLPNKLIDEDILSILKTYVTINLDYYDTASGLLNGLYSEPVEWIDSANGRNITKWRYINDNSQEDTAFSKVTLGAHYFSGHIVGRGNWIGSPLKLTLSDRQFKSDGKTPIKGKVSAIWDSIDNLSSKDMFITGFATTSEGDFDETSNQFESNIIDDVITFNTIIESMDNVTTRNPQISPLKHPDRFEKLGITTIKSSIIENKEKIDAILDNFFNTFGEERFNRNGRELCLDLTNPTESFCYSDASMEIHISQEVNIPGQTYEDRSNCRRSSRTTEETTTIFETDFSIPIDSYNESDVLNTPNYWCFIEYTDNFEQDGLPSRSEIKVSSADGNTTSVPNFLNPIGLVAESNLKIFTPLDIFETDKSVKNNEDKLSSTDVPTVNVKLWKTEQCPFGSDKNDWYYLSWEEYSDKSRKYYNEAYDSDDVTARYDASKNNAIDFLRDIYGIEIEIDRASKRYQSAYNDWYAAKSALDRISEPPKSVSKPKQYDEFEGIKADHEAIEDLYDELDDLWANRVSKPTLRKEPELPIRDNYPSDKAFEVAMSTYDKDHAAWVTEKKEYDEAYKAWNDWNTEYTSKLEEKDRAVADFESRVPNYPQLKNAVEAYDAYITKLKEWEAANNINYNSYVLLKSEVESYEAEEGEAYTEYNNALKKRTDRMDGAVYDVDNPPVEPTKEEIDKTKYDSEDDYLIAKAESDKKYSDAYKEFTKEQLKIKYSSKTGYTFRFDDKIRSDPYKLGEYVINPSWGTQTKSREEWISYLFTITSGQTQTANKATTKFLEGLRDFATTDKLIEDFNNNMKSKLEWLNNPKQFPPFLGQRQIELETPVEVIKKSILIYPSIINTMPNELVLLTNYDILGTRTETDSLGNDILVNVHKTDSYNEEKNAIDNGSLISFRTPNNDLCFFRVKNKRHADLSAFNYKVKTPNSKDYRAKFSPNGEFEKLLPEKKEGKTDREDILKFIEYREFDKVGTSRGSGFHVYEYILTHPIFTIKGFTGRDQNDRIINLDKIVRIDSSSMCSTENFLKIVDVKDYGGLLGKPSDVFKFRDSNFLLGCPISKNTNGTFTNHISSDSSSDRYQRQSQYLRDFDSLLNNYFTKSDFDGKFKSNLLRDIVYDFNITQANGENKKPLKLRDVPVLIKGLGLVDGEGFSSSSAISLKNLLGEMSAVMKDRNDKSYISLDNLLNRINQADKQTLSDSTMRITKSAITFGDDYWNVDSSDNSMEDPMENLMTKIKSEIGSKINITTANGEPMEYPSLSEVYSAVTALEGENLTDKICENIDNIFGNNTYPLFNIIDNDYLIPVDSNSISLINQYKTYVCEITTDVMWNYHCSKGLFTDLGNTNSDKDKLKQRVEAYYNLADDLPSPIRFIGKEFDKDDSSDVDYSKGKGKALIIIPKVENNNLVRSFRGDSAIITDENGEPVKDENGNPQRVPTYYFAQRVFTAPSALKETTISEKALSLIAKEIREDLMGRKEGSDIGEDTDSENKYRHPVACRPGQGSPTGNSNGLYYIRYLILNGRMNKLNGKLFQAASYLRNKDVFNVNNSILESKAKTYERYMSCIPVAKKAELTYIPSNDNPLNGVTMDGRFYSTEEMDYLRVQINKKCILTCYNCSVKDKCMFYDEESLLKLNCTPIKTLDIWVKDNKLDMLVYNDDYPQIEYRDGDARISFDKDILKKYHYPYSEIARKSTGLDNHQNIQNMRPIKGEIENQLPSVESELKSSTALVYPNERNFDTSLDGGLGWLTGARYGTVQINNAEQLMNAEYPGLRLPKYRYLYDALFVNIIGDPTDKDFEEKNTYVTYRPSKETYIVSDIEVMDSNGRLRVYGEENSTDTRKAKGRVQVFLPSNLRILEEAEADDDVYLVSDDTTDSSGNPIEPVIYLSPVRNLQISFNIEEDPKKGKTQAKDVTIYASDIAQWSANMIKGICASNPVDKVPNASEQIAFKNLDQYWMDKIYKKVKATDSNGLPIDKYIELPGRDRISSGYQEPLVSVEDIDESSVLSGRPIVANYIDFIRRVSIKMCDTVKDDPSRVVWYIKWSKEAERLKELNPEANASKIASILEEKRRTLPEMHTNLRLVVVKNFK